MRLKKFSKYLLIVAGAAAVGAVALSAMTFPVSLPLPPVSVVVKRSILSDLMSAPESASLSGSVNLKGGRYAISEAGIDADLAIPKSGSIATLSADRFAAEVTSMPSDKVKLKALPGPGTVKFSPTIRLTTASGAAIDVKSISLNETGKTAEAQIQLALARSLFNVVAGHAIAEPDASQGGADFAAKLIEGVKVDRFACTFKQGSEIRLTKDQVLVLGTGGSAELHGVSMTSINNVSGFFKAQIPLVGGTRITGADFIVQPESAQLALAGTYRRQAGVEDLRVKAADKTPFLTMSGVVANPTGAPIVRVGSMAAPEGEFNVHQSNGVRQVTLAGTGSLVADIANAPFPGGHFLLAGLKSELKFRLTTDGKSPSFTGSINSASADSWRVRAESGAHTKVELGGAALNFQDINFNNLGALTLSVPAGKIQPSSAIFSNKKGTVTMVLDQRSTITVTGAQPIQFGVGGKTAITIGEMQLAGVFPSLTVHLGGRDFSAKDCNGTVRLITAGTLRAMGDFELTADGGSIARSLDKALGEPSRFNIEDLKVTGLSCSSGDASLKCVFDVSGVSDGTASVKIRVPKGFRVNASGSGLRDSRLDASFIGRGFDADLDLDRGEAKTTLEFDLVNRNRVSPLTRHKDISTSPWTEFTARAWIFIKPCTVSLRLNGTVRLSGDGRVTLRLNSWEPIDLSQGIPLDSDTKKMPGVHGTIRPINAPNFKMHANYIGDFTVANPVPKALNGLIGREIVIRN